MTYDEFDSKKIPLREWTTISETYNKIDRVDKVCPME
jgi:hypothetical protein